ncbi:DUF5916 domain-containing protein [Mucilaginibacter agri]|uniref:DUF5916 domain-containing protein n=1 Tax=Mucilaginibacter agri TaxID=2695265 RepID=A0A966DTJ9_9SPHI|nr:DUF5916 domain-containing protein [Mucilaginibacter agri]NCD69412.1 hypothetical protein [Mucilaginibacter agri]
MPRFYTLLFFILISFSAISQPVIRKLAAIKTTVAPKIDGSLDDDVWKNVPIATDFVELNPTSGRHEKPEERTEIKIIYDNEAIYVGARMYETSADKVARELTTRDNIANDDFLGIVLDTYLDRINGSGFYVTAAGVQFDAKYSNQGNEDPNWNSVWISKVKVDNQGWTAEFKIPYSALRFANKEVQTWGLNFVRKRNFEQKQLFWNEIDPKKNGFINQEGELTGIEKVTPPVRLAFYPYASTYVNHYPYNTTGVKNTTNSFNGGMDVKYGINASFTLDMTLIPDFGQVQSDNRILNLTPFEVKYNENRPFFTEGTELFNKGNLFYSRRVGGQPIDYNNAYDNLAPNEAVIKNPTETKLYNATKFSGRMANGLGIGVFNAVSAPAYATIQDTVTNTSRKVQTSPVTNYNIIVLDQNLKNNSAVTFINTNVDRFGKDYNADVGGFVFSLNNKKNSYNLSGFAMMSNLFYTDRQTTTGYSYEINAGKTLGNFTWNIIEDLVDSKYSSNDLGIMFNNNYFDHNINMYYNSYKPKRYFTSWGIYGNVYYSRRYKPSAYQTLNFNSEYYFTTKKGLWRGYIDLSYKAAGNDFYEPRVAGLVYQTPASAGIGGGINSNRAKRFYGGIFYFYRKIDRLSGYGYDSEAYYTFRISNKFSFGQDVIYSPRINYTGFSTLDSAGTTPIFALRNVHTIENIFNLKYTFNNTMGLTLRARHYWSKLNNKQFYNLSPDGALVDLTSTNFNHDNDQNFNTWNLDMIYAWVFSPGSELSLAWKGSSQTNTDQARNGYLYNLHDTFTQPQNNNFSIKVLYYIDYQSLRKKKHA